MNKTPEAKWEAQEMADAKMAELKAKVDLAAFCGTGEASCDA